MTQPGRIVRFAVLTFGILFFDSAAFGQQSQSWKFPLSIPTTQSGFPSPVVASTGPLAVGTYSITAKTSLQNLYAAREPSGKCYLVLLDANGNVIPDSQLDETDVTLDQTSNGADTASLMLSAVYVVTAVGPNNVGVHCMASQKSQFMNTVITATSLQGPAGPQGTPGLPGAPGAAATVQVGSTTTLGSNGLTTVTNTGTPNAAVLNFAIPQGQTGATGSAGAAATVTVGTTTTGMPGTSALVTNAGSSGAALLNFVIPQGATGVQGQPGPKGDTGTPGPAGRGFTTNFAAFSSSGTATFVVPDGVSSLLVEAVGAGGAGDPLGGGGGSGAYERAVLSVVAGSSCTITVGAGHTAGSGGNSLVQDQSGTTLVCGAGGQNGLGISPGLGGFIAFSCPPQLLVTPGLLDISGLIGQPGQFYNLPVNGGLPITVAGNGGAPVMFGAGGGGSGGTSGSGASPGPPQAGQNGYVLISW